MWKARELRQRPPTIGASPRSSGRRACVCTTRGSDGRTCAPFGSETAAMAGAGTRGLAPSWSFSWWYRRCGSRTRARLRPRWDGPSLHLQSRSTALSRAFCASPFEARCATSHSASSPVFYSLESTIHAPNIFDRPNRCRISRRLAASPRRAALAATSPSTLRPAEDRPNETGT